MALMNWNNLRHSRCPKCNRKLDFISDKEMMMCTISCGFMISPGKMQQIIENQIIKNIEKQEYNQELLNNL